MKKRKERRRRWNKKSTHRDKEKKKNKEETREHGRKREGVGCQPPMAPLPLSTLPQGPKEEVSIRIAHVTHINKNAKQLNWKPPTRVHK